jgi:hypothetical protein
MMTTLMQVERPTEATTGVEQGPYTPGEAVRLSWTTDRDPLLEPDQVLGGRRDVFGRVSGLVVPVETWQPKRVHHPANAYEKVLRDSPVYAARVRAATPAEAAPILEREQACQERAKAAGVAPAPGPREPVQAARDLVTLWEAHHPDPLPDTDAHRDGLVRRVAARLDEAEADGQDGAASGYLRPTDFPWGIRPYGRRESLYTSGAADASQMVGGWLAATQLDGEVAMESKEIQTLLVLLRERLAQFYLWGGLATPARTLENWISTGQARCPLPPQGAGPNPGGEEPCADGSAGAASGRARCRPHTHSDCAPGSRLIPPTCPWRALA